MNRLRFVLFDAGGTLIGPSAVAPIETLLRSRGASGESAPLQAIGISRKARQRHLDLTTNRRRAHLPPDTAGYLWKQAFEYATADLALAADLLALFFAGKLDQPYPDALCALKALRNRGFRLAVVSNFSEDLPSLLDGFGLLSFFETVVVSACEGTEKPDPAIFRVALDRLSAKPGEAIYIGDNPDIDLKGSKAAGMQFVLVDRAGTLANEYPDTVSDLLELLTLDRLRSPANSDREDRGPSA